MYTVKPSKQFSKDLKRVSKRNYNIDLLTDVIKKLSEGEPLDVKYRDHALKGNYEGYRECHITPDWLLIYKIYYNKLILLLTRTGTHSDLF